MLVSSDLKFTYVDACEPDSIGVEISGPDDHQICDIVFEESGRRSIQLDSGPHPQLDAEGFIEGLRRAVSELERWEANLRQQEVWGTRA